jgi:hypothetical protein
LELKREIHPDVWQLFAETNTFKINLTHPVSELFKDSENVRKKIVG